MKIGGKPSGPPLDLALSLQIARLTNTDENIINECQDGS